ncbi:aspartate/glutamate racemase family protein [Peptoniphilus sp. oral taxon 386]|uniref:aspartate/glutamate racemase family protein n=1 Tax=Peptoniphilus sp. oral taxon 386 TaxID=652713 RepID=UPI0002E2A790|nr:aspartate/glutamate racemase family protein [Peptoniphilus sp. oral taxon 386]
MKVAVFAGTKVDTQMGVELLAEKKIEAMTFPMSESCEEQSKLQYFSKEELENLFIEKAKSAIDKGADKLLINCNSLSCAIDYKKIEELIKLEIITPLETYKSLPKGCNNIAIIGANGLSAYTIDKIIKESDETKNTISVGNMSIVQMIEAGFTPKEIVEGLNLDGFLNYLENIKIGKYKVDSIILGCTHFPYIRDELKKRTSLIIIDPAEKMLERI